MVRERGGWHAYAHPRANPHICTHIRTHMRTHTRTYRVVIEDLLRAVAVMHVPIDEEHATKAVDLEGGFGGHRGAVEEAEAAHPVGARVVTRRAHHREARAQPARANLVGQSDDSPGGESRGARGGGVMEEVRPRACPAVRRLAERTRRGGDLSKPAADLPRRRVLERVQRIAVLSRVATERLLAVASAHAPSRNAGISRFFRACPT